MSFSQANIELLMQNYALEELFFSFEDQEKNLLEALEFQEKELHFPAIKKDVGRLLTFFTQIKSPQNIFEFGSGYGHSAYWYLLAKKNLLEKIYLTEKRDDLEDVFNKLPWPSDWKERIDYYQGDAFERLDQLDLKFDLVLVDGMKAQYQDFLIKIYEKINDDGIIVVDNCFWKGRFLNEKELHRKSPLAIKNLHAWLKEQTIFNVCFLPVSDGLFLLSKK